MQAGTAWEGKSEAALEQWFLESLGQNPLPHGHLLAALEARAGNGDRARAAEWGELLLDAAAERGLQDEALAALDLLCRLKDEAGFRADCAAAAARILPGRLGQAFVKGAGFDRGLPLTECVRRLRLLRALQPGALCLDRTWGFGVVARLDDFYEKVTVDFSRKPGHAMSFAHAADALSLVTEDHLLARRHRDPEGLRALAGSRPDELVRIVLRSYGPQPAQRIQEILTAEVLGTADWKPFWDAARKALKADPRVEVPAKRGEPLRLLEAERSIGADWVGGLAGERDPARLLARLDEAGADALAALDGEARKMLAERLAFALWACDRRAAATLAQLLMRAAALGYDGPLDTSVAGGADGMRRDLRVEPARCAEALLAPDALATCLEGLPAREVPRFLEFFADRMRDRALDALAAVLPRLPASLLDHVAPCLAARGRAAQCREHFAAILSGAPDGEQLYWLARDPAQVERWSGLRAGDVAIGAVNWLGVGEGQGRRIHKLVRSLFEDRAWLEAVMRGMSVADRQVLFRKVQACAAWEESGRRSALAAMIRLYPELQAVAAQAAKARESAGPARLTSWRSYRERQARLKELIEKTIPENSREIAHARGYGDLRENFEYQAAKDRQRLLLRRRAELEADLEQVQGTDFAGLPADVAGLGTVVTVRRPDGAEERYCVLGEWDRDEALGIISSRSRIGELLQGRRPGDRVVLPGPAGDSDCTIAAVAPLDDAVRGWLAGP